MKEWREVEVANDYNDKLFMILEQQLIKKFFTNKLKLNPSKDSPPLSFVDTLRRWKSSKNPKGVLVDALVFENSYKCQEITNISTLKEILDFERTVDFLQQKTNGIIIMICTTNNFEEFNVWKGDKWDSIFAGLKDFTMHIDVWVRICEKESFGYLMSIVHKIVIDPYIEYEIGPTLHS